MTNKKRREILLKAFKKRYLNKIIYDRIFNICEIIEIKPALDNCFIWIFCIIGIESGNLYDDFVIHYTTYILREDMKQYFETDFFLVKK